MLICENEPLFEGRAKEMEEGNQVLSKFSLGFLGLLRDFGEFLIVF